MTEKQLLPASVRSRLPSIRAAYELPLDALMVEVKFFYPDFNWTWYGIAWDGEDIFFGLVDGFEAEFGSFSLRELMETRGRLGCAIERDRSFAPQPVKPIYERAKARRALPA
jgi:hypothetical protein